MQVNFYRIIDILLLILSFHSVIYPWALCAIVKILCNSILERLPIVIIVNFKFLTFHVKSFLKFFFW